MLTGARLQAEDTAVMMIPTVQSPHHFSPMRSFPTPPSEVPVCQILPQLLLALMLFFERTGCAPSPEHGSNKIHSGRRLRNCITYPCCPSLPRKKRKRTVTYQTMERRWMGRRTLLLSRVSCWLERFLNCEEVRCKPARLLMEPLGSVGRFLIRIFLLFQ